MSKEDRGFATMIKTPEGQHHQRLIASKGGKTSQAKGTGHRWTAEQAQEAGRKGGLARHKNRPSLPITSTPIGDPTPHADRTLSV